jgi:hypothetical protein
VEEGASTVKTLSGRQPWWWAILHAGKRIENRTWNTRYRGPILLHAASGCTRGEYERAIRWMLDAGVLDPGLAVPPLDQMPRGGIVGRARIVGVIEPHCPAVLYPAGVVRAWHMPEQFGFVLADVAPLPFAPCCGRLGIFELPDVRIPTSEEELA